MSESWVLHGSCPGPAQRVGVLVERDAPHPQERDAAADEQAGSRCAKQDHQIASAAKDLHQGGQIADQHSAKEQVQDQFLEDHGGQHQQPE